MAQTTYTFYLSNYGGTLSEETFNRLRGRASAWLSALTLGRSDKPDLPDALRQSVNMAACALIDAMHEVAEGGAVASESNDGISVTYATKVQQTDARRFYDAACSYLAWTGLLYRGCYG